MCYFEHVIDNVEEKKNAFTKKMDKVGELVDRKRVMVFADDDNAIDCKSHFEYITHKIDFNAKGFVEAVEEAIAMKLAAVNGEPVVTKKEEVKNVVEAKPEPVKVSEPYVDDDEPPFDIDDELDNVELEVDIDAIKTEIRNKNKSGTPEQKKAVKAIIAETGNKLDAIDDIEILTKMLEVFE
jgi:hypothetical protein